MASKVEASAAASRPLGSVRKPAGLMVSLSMVTSRAKWEGVERSSANWVLSSSEAGWKLC